MLVSGRVNHLLSYFTKHLKLPKGVIGTGTRLSICCGGGEYLIIEMFGTIVLMKTKMTLGNGGGGVYPDCLY